MGFIWCWVGRHIVEHSEGQRWYSKSLGVARLILCCCFLLLLLAISFNAEISSIAKSVSAVFSTASKEWTLLEHVILYASGFGLLGGAAFVLIVLDLHERDNYIQDALHEEERASDAENLVAFAQKEIGELEAVDANAFLEKVIFASTEQAKYLLGDEYYSIACNWKPFLTESSCNLLSELSEYTLQISDRNLGK